MQVTLVFETEQYEGAATPAVGCNKRSVVYGHFETQTLFDMHCNEGTGNIM